jgi:hypothetical protein
MKLPIAAIAVLTLAPALGANRAEAQFPVNYGSWDSRVGVDASATYTYYPSYSYWTAAYYGYPPRVYVGYGSNDFPYYGRPYGSPSDPWSWPAMAGYYSAVPTRYNLMFP